MSRETFAQSVGSTLQLACVVLLLGLIPYSLYAAYGAYAAIAAWNGDAAGFPAYPLARLVACIILCYALWQLRKTGSRLRLHRRPSPRPSPTRGEGD